MKIDREFGSLIPPLSDQEKQQLEDNLKIDGCRDALLDGHNRLEICNRLGIKFKTREIELANRNLSAFARAELALKLQPLIAQQAKENQIRKPQSVPQKSAEQKIETRRELAKASLSEVQEVR